MYFLKQLLSLSILTIKKNKRLVLIKILFIAIFLDLSLFNHTLFAQTIFQRSIGGGAKESGMSVQLTSDGGYVITGISTSYGSGGADVYLLKVNGNGNLQWSKAFGGTRNDFAEDVQTTSDGGYIITGRTLNFGVIRSTISVYLLKIDNTGNLQWSNTYGYTGSDHGYSVQETTDGGYIIAGLTQRSGTGDDVFLIKTFNNGNLDWSKQFHNPNGGIEHGYSLQQTTDGGYIIAGLTAPNHDVYLLKTDNNGNLEWTRTFGGTGRDIANSVQQTTDGGFIITGETSSFGAGGQDVYLLRTDANGDLLWSKTFGGSERDIGYYVRQTNDGGYIIAGVTASFGVDFWDAYLIKTDGNGNLEWSKTFGGVSVDIGRSVQQTQDGGYIVTGATNSFGGGTNVYLIKTDNLGNSGCNEGNPITLESSGGNTGFGGIQDIPLTLVIPGGIATTQIDNVINLCQSSGCNLTATATSTNVSCNGICDGSIDLILSGGTLPFIFTWSNGATTKDISGLCPGSYTVNIIDNNGCTASASVTISEPPLLTASITGTNVSCNGVCDGIADLTVTGGTPPLVFSWSNGATIEDISSLCAGSFTVGITDNNGCTASASIIISEPAILIANAGLDVTICSGESVTIGGSPTASGGTSPYIYTWSPTSNLDDPSTANPNASPTITTDYIVTLTDVNGCTATDVLTVFVNPSPTINAATDKSVAIINSKNPNVKCANFSVTVTGGTSPYNYLWSPATYLDDPTIPNPRSCPTVAGFITYTVTVTDINGCIATDQVTIEAIVVPLCNPGQAEICHVDPDGTCTTMCVSLNAACAAPVGLCYHLENHPNDSPGPCNCISKTSSNIQGSESVTAIEGDNDTHSYDAPDLLELNVRHSLQNTTTIFPNPNNGEFTLTMVSENKNTPTSIYIYNTLGEILYKDQNIDHHVIYFDISGQPKGVYYVKVIKGEEMYVDKIIYQ